MHEDHSVLAEQFDDLEQQKTTATLGMWAFLATEILFFGGLFFAYTVYRITYPHAFVRAGRELNVTVGTINTAILLTSSYFVALAVHSIQKGKKNKAFFYLAATWILGFSFLGLKAYEYYDDFEKNLVPTIHVAIEGADAPAARLFYFIYYAMTGLHAIHMIIGLVIIAIIAHRTLKGFYSNNYYNQVEIGGLYWHFVDLIWIFLYPLLYLMDRYT
jgi:cytochrome c oxidase subunit 3